MVENNKLMILSARACKKKHHVSYDTVLGMENAFIKEGAELKEFSKYCGFVNKVLNKVNLHQRLFDWTIFNNLSKKNILFIAMGIGDLIQYKKELKKIAKNNTLGIYCFDVWEAHYSEYKKMFDFISPKLIFLAYREAYRYFKKEYNCWFIPQSMDTDFFYPRNVEKKRLFMQMGRRNEKIHIMILKYLERNNIPVIDENYIFEKNKGNILFPNTNELATEIARTKYFVAAPQACENKILTGKVSDVTARFYEAMACKTLIIGYKPDTFDALFPKDAMIDLNDTGKSLDDIIDYFEKFPEKYRYTVNRNYELLLKKHTWKVRYKEIEKIFRNVNKSL